jgi:hypothetical protein
MRAAVGRFREPLGGGQDGTDVQFTGRPKKLVIAGSLDQILQRKGAYGTEERLEVVFY